MSENTTPNSVKRSEVLLMTAVAEASSLLRQLAEPRPIGDTVKAAISRAARLARMNYSRAEDIWRREAKMVRAEEMDVLRQAKLEHARAEYARLKRKIAALESIQGLLDQNLGGG